MADGHIRNAWYTGKSGLEIRGLDRHRQIGQGWCGQGDVGMRMYTSMNVRARRSGHMRVQARRCGHEGAGKEMLA